MFQDRNPNRLLTADFLAPYRKARDVFPNLLARSVYLGKYSRNGESWTDTVARCVEGNCLLDPSVKVQEAELLFDCIWRMKGLPPGRGLWTGGVLGIPVDARYNCHYTTLRSIEDWCWTANMLMCGGGVGVGIYGPSQLPIPEIGEARLAILCSRSHSDAGEVMPDSHVPSADIHLVEDSRLGWVAALRATLFAAFAGTSLVVNVSPVRPRGTSIRTFGGVASGPGPLVVLLRAVWAIVRRSAGRALTSVEKLDVTNHIGMCIKSGNVRRSALIVLGDATDTPFRVAKKDWDAVLSHRHSSNNSIVFEHESDIEGFDWNGLISDNAEYGEPGIVNLWKIRRTDCWADGINPCGEIPLHDREACCLSEVYPSRASDNVDMNTTLMLMTRYTLRQRLEPMSDPEAEATRARNMRIGVGLGGICDFEWTNRKLKSMYSHVNNSAIDYADALGVNIPIALTTVKPSGTISLLNGSSPGMHAPYAPYYIRRTRLSSGSEMANALISAGVPNEICQYDSSGRTLVFMFPMSAPDRSSYASTESVRSQVLRQVALQQYWSDNAVSGTISFNVNEKQQLANLLSTYIGDLKSVSCLPRAHGYAQPPYEEIDETLFRDMAAKIDFSHPLTTGGGEIEIEECEGGACPVK